MSRAFAQGPALPAGDLGQALQDFSKLSASQKNMILEGTGIPRARDFNPARIMAYFIFGAVGFVAFVYGKKNAFWRPMVIGLTLMIYPYFVSGTVSLYLVGVLLIAALYFWRE